MQDSIYYYKYGQFKHFIQRIDDESMCVSDALGTFREVKCLSNEFKRITVQQLTGKPNLIIELSKSLRKGMKPESRFKLPYRREEREQELINNISENYPIDRNKSKAKVITGHYKNENTGQEFNYSLEVVIAPRTGIGAENAGQVEFIGNINSTPSIDGGERYFEGTQEEYI